MGTKQHLTFLVAALLACTAATPVLAGDKILDTHGGRMVEIRGGRLEWIHDGANDTLTIHATQPDGQPLEMHEAPELVLSSSTPKSMMAPHDVAFEAVTDTPGAWRTACPRHAGWSAMSVSVRVMVDERSELVALSPKPQVSHGVLIFGDDALRLKVTSDEPKGLITFQPLTAEDAKALGNALPKVIVNRSGTEMELATTRGGEARDTYVLADTTSLRNAQDVVVRVQIAGRTVNAHLVLAPDETRGIHGGAMVAFESPVDGTEDQRFEVIHDATAGTLTVCQADSVGQSILGAPPSVVLTTASGSKTLETVAIRGIDGSWRVQAAELEGEQLDGTLRVIIDEETRDVVIPGMPLVRVTPAIG